MTLFQKNGDNSRTLRNYCTKTSETLYYMTLNHSKVFSYNIATISDVTSKNDIKTAQKVVLAKLVSKVPKMTVHKLLKL